MGTGSFVATAGANGNYIEGLVGVIVAGRRHKALLLLVVRDEALALLFGVGEPRARSLDLLHTRLCFVGVRRRFSLACRCALDRWNAHRL